MFEGTGIMNTTRFDKAAWPIYRTTRFVWQCTIIYGALMSWWSALGGFVILVITVLVDTTITRVWTHGFRVQRTEDQRWQDRYDSAICARDELNHNATIWWMLGFRRHALTLIDRADDAWLDAQLALAREEEC